MKVIGMIADHPTPKAKADDDSAYTLNSRDYKGVMLVVISKGDGCRLIQSNHNRECCESTERSSN